MLPRPRQGPAVEVRASGAKGRGVFAIEPIEKGSLVVECSGELLPGNRLRPHHFALQVGPDLWLCSDGASLDDCLNHGCEPNLGFVTGEPALYALRDVAPGEELVWDYSTSLA